MITINTVEQDHNSEPQDLQPTLRALDNNLEIANYESESGSASLRLALGLCGALLVIGDVPYLWQQINSATISDPQHFVAAALATILGTLLIYEVLFDERIR